MARKIQWHVQLIMPRAHRTASKMKSAATFAPSQFYASCET